MYHHREELEEVEEELNDEELDDEELDVEELDVEEEQIKEVPVAESILLLVNKVMIAIPDGVINDAVFKPEVDGRLRVTWNASKIECTFSNDELDVHRYFYPFYRKKFALPSNYDEAVRYVISILSNVLKKINSDVGIRKQNNTNKKSNINQDVLFYYKINCIFLSTRVVCYI